MTGGRLDTTVPAVLIALLLGLVLLAGGFGWSAATTGSDVAPSSPAAGPSSSASQTAQASASGRPEQVVGGHAGRPAPTPPASDHGDLLVEDHCVDRDLPTPPVSDPIFAILDRTYALPADYVPADLVPATRAGFSGASGGSKLVREVLIADLAAMRAAWRAEGLDIQIQSAYRSYRNQVSTFNHWVTTRGLEEALIRSARPGHSEHQLGTAIDFTSPGWWGTYGDWGGSTAEGAWMLEHAWRYGFVLSYPPGASERTCFDYEPWHYRWIGREAAADWEQSGLVLRDFLERYLVSDGSDD